MRSHSSVYCLLQVVVLASQLQNLFGQKQRLLLHDLQLGLGNLVRLVGLKVGDIHIGKPLQLLLLFLLDLVEHLVVVVAHYLRLLNLVIGVKAKSILADHPLPLFFALVQFVFVVAQRSLVAVQTCVVSCFELNVGHVGRWILQSQVLFLHY